MTRIIASFAVFFWAIFLPPTTQAAQLSEIREFFEQRCLASLKAGQIGNPSGLQRTSAQFEKRHLGNMRGKVFQRNKKEAYPDIKLLLVYKGKLRGCITDAKNIDVQAVGKYLETWGKKNASSLTQVKEKKTEIGTVRVYSGRLSSGETLTVQAMIIGLAGVNSALGNRLKITVTRSPGGNS